MTIWEHPPLPLKWAEVINESVDELWLPNAWVAGIFKEAGVKHLPHIVPHCDDPAPYAAGGDEPELRKMKARSLLGLPHDAFIFYSVFDWTPRKAPLDLCVAFLRAFSDHGAGVMLFLKLHTGGYGPSQLPTPRAIIDQAREIVGNRTTPIFFHDGGWDAGQMMALRHASDCFVSLTRSEGWGLPQFEAALCGTPVITTGWSGVKAFLQDDSAYFIDYELAAVDWKFILQLEPNQTWALANIDHAAELIRHVRENYDEALAKGAKARARCAEQFSLDAVAKTITGILTR